MGFYIPEDGILHSYCRENLKSYTMREICKNLKGVLWSQMCPEIPQ
jgi:hypothetical protein